MTAQKYLEDMDEVYKNKCSGQFVPEDCPNDGNCASCSSFLGETFGFATTDSDLSEYERSRYENSDRQ